MRNKYSLEVKRSLEDETVVEPKDQAFKLYKQKLFPKTFTIICFLKANLRITYPLGTNCGYK